MTTYVSIPLDPSSYYGLSIALEGNSYNLDFIYNERTRLYHLSLYDSNNSPIVLGIGLVPSYPITFDYAISNLTGYFWLGQKGVIVTEKYKEFPELISQDYNLFYIYEKED